VEKISKALPMILKGGIPMWGRYLWKLRLLLTIPYLLFAILMFSSIGNDKDYGYYWMAFVVYAIVSNIILHKMEKKEKVEKE
jgi:hypothetical protein